MLLLYVHSENIMYHLHVPMKENPQLSLSLCTVLTLRNRSHAHPMTIIHR